jgi:DNA-binding NarL/FixJ family response regulator
MKLVIDSEEMPLPGGMSARGRPHPVKGAGVPAILGQKSASVPPVQIATKKQREHCIHTIIIDTNLLIRAGLIYMLRETRFRIISSCTDLCELPTDLFNGSEKLMLIGLGNNSSEILSQVSAFKEQHHETHIIVLVDSFRLEELVAATEAGADGYVLKGNLTGDSISKVLDLVLHGLTILPQDFAHEVHTWTSGQGSARSQPQDLLAHPQPPQPQPAVSASGLGSAVGLSNREQLIVEYLTRGASNKAIARELDIAEATVKAHVKALLRKIGAMNRTQAAVWAMNGFPGQMKPGPS